MLQLITQAEIFLDATRILFTLLGENRKQVGIPTKARAGFFQIGFGTK